MSDHLDSMDHAELASKTRELLRRLTTGDCLMRACSPKLSEAVAALQPSPLDKLRQTLREQGWVRYEECPKGGYSSSLSLSRTGEYVETWVHDAH